MLQTPKASARLLRLLLPLLALSACGNMQGSAKGKNSTSTTFSLSAPNAASISSIYPADGAIAAPPTSVNITFSSGNLEGTLLQAITSYVINCGGLDLTAQSVAYVPGVASVAVTMPTITGLSSGTVCTFKISSNLKDGYGNFLLGSHTATYTINSNASVSGGGWAPASSITATDSAGAAAGAGFHAVGGTSTELTLQGLLVNGTQYADGVVGNWAPRFTTGTTIYGQTHGSSNGGFTAVSCPAGYRVTGLHGRAGAYIDAIGIVCKNESQSQTWRSAAQGGSGGTAFELSCPAGQFATDLMGRAGSYLNQVQLGCR